jgi:hypothetical protein
MTKYYKCGREFSETDIKRIQKIVKENQGVSRCQLSRLVCEAFDWYSENGTIKGFKGVVVMELDIKPKSEHLEK